MASRPWHPPRPKPMLAEALRLVALGLRVTTTYPRRYSACTCAEGVRCEHTRWHLVENFLEVATTDPEVIRGWFEDPWDPENGRNAAIVTGRASGVVALRIDSAGDFKSLEALEQRHGALPRIAIVGSTWGVGYVLFLHPDGPVPQGERLIAPGIHALAEDEVIFVPPSDLGRGNTRTWYRHPGLGLEPPPPWWYLPLDEQLFPPAKSPPKTPTVEVQAPPRPFAAFIYTAFDKQDGIELPKGPAAQAAAPGPSPAARAAPAPPPPPPLHGAALEAAASDALKAAAAQAPAPVNMAITPAMSMPHALKALGGEALHLGRARSGEGVRKAAVKLWPHVSRGDLTLDDLRRVLLVASRQNGLPDKVTLKAIEAGLRVAETRARRRSR